MTITLAPLPAGVLVVRVDGLDGSPLYLLNEAHADEAQQIAEALSAH